MRTTNIKYDEVLEIEREDDLPPQAGQAGRVLTTDNKVASWTSVPGAGDSDKTDLKLEFKTSLNSAYTEITYALGVITNVDIWETSLKANKLFTKVFTYSAGLLTLTVLTDNTNSKVLTTTFSYTAGILDKITEVVT